MAMEVDHALVDLADRFDALRREIGELEAHRDRLMASKPLLFGRRAHQEKVDESERRLCELQAEAGAIQQTVRDALDKCYVGYKTHVQLSIAPWDGPHRSPEHLQALTKIHDMLQTVDDDQDRQHLASRMLFWALTERHAIPAEEVEQMFDALKSDLDKRVILAARLADAVPDESQIDEVAQMLTEQFTDKWANYESYDVFVNYILGWFQSMLGGYVTNLTSSRPTALSAIYFERALSYFGKAMEAEVAEGDMDYLYRELASSKYQKIKDYGC